jgi:cell division protein ZapA (FtsZ GTPase activity inhibitor)
MHLEPLEKLPRSVREFLSHYAMIVLSILTALALEQLALGIEHRHEGARAKEEVEQEIASNRKMVEEALQITRENKRDWEALFARTVADVRAGQSTDESLEATLRDARPWPR